MLRRVLNRLGDKYNNLLQEYGQSSQRSESEVHRRVIYSSQLTYQQKECNKKKRVISSLGYLIGFRLLGRLQNTFFSLGIFLLENRNTQHHHACLTFRNLHIPSTAS